MTVKRVTWEYMQGVTALVNLMKMMEAALPESQPTARFKRTGGFGHCGFLVKDKYWFGVRYQRPLVVVFENNQGYPPITYKKDLDLEAKHFFSLTEGEQFECMTTFLRDAWQGAEPAATAAHEPPSAPAPAS